MLKEHRKRKQRLLEAGMEDLGYMLALGRAFSAVDELYARMARRVIERV